MPRVLISVAAYTDSPRLRELIYDLDETVSFFQNDFSVLVVFDRPFDHSLSYYLDLNNDKVKVLFKGKNKGETDSVNLSVRYARDKNCEFFVHLDEDIKVNRDNFLKIVDELIASPDKDIISARMIRRMIDPDFLCRQMNHAFVKILERYHNCAHFVDGRFFIARTKHLPPIPENINNDHYLTLYFDQERIGISQFTTAEFVTACSFHAYFNSHFKYRINEQKIKWSYPELYAKQKKICDLHCGGKITAPPKALLPNIYREVNADDRFFHRLDRCLAWLIKIYSQITFFLNPKKYLSSYSWQVELDQKGFRSTS